MSRDYRYLEEAGIVLAVDVKAGRARVALAACNTEDPFKPGVGKDIVNALLDNNADTLKAFQLSRNVVSFPYSEDKPRNHILKPLIDFMADELGERMFFRQLHLMFMSGITTQEVAAQVSNELGDEATYYKFKALAGLLEEEDLELLDTIDDEQDFYQAFFMWSGSVDRIMSKLRKFSTAVHTSKILLKDPTTKVSRKKTRKKDAASSKNTDSKVPAAKEKARSVAAAPVKSKKKSVAVSKK